MQDDKKNRNYQKYNSVSPGVELLLAQSLKNFEGHSLRNVNCPYCGFCVDRVGKDNTGFIFARCPKCKHEQILDLRYFRTAKVKQSPIKKKPIPEFVPGLINFLRQDLF